MFKLNYNIVKKFVLFLLDLINFNVNWQTITIIFNSPQKYWNL